MNGCRWPRFARIGCVLVNIFCCFLCVRSIADRPELPPSYAETQLLREDASLRGVAFRDASVGVAVGDRGNIVRTADGGISWQAIDCPVQCTLTDVAWIDINRIIAIGGGFDAITQISRGVVLISNDAGRTWRRSDDGELPRLSRIEVRQDRSLCAHGDWSPSTLTRYFTSHDGGQRWTGTESGISETLQSSSATSNQLLQWVRVTNVPVAIRDACRVGSDAVCAVGDHGVILTSNDDGNRWDVRRGSGRHTSVLMVSRSAASVAWSILGSESLESRNRTSLLLDTVPAKSDEPSETDLAAQAAIMLGGSGADRLRTSSDSDNKVDIDQAAMQWIAVMRPAVVALDQTLAPETRDAFFRAATALGVSRIAEYSDGRLQATTLHRDAMLPKTGILASDLTIDAMQLIAPWQCDAASFSIRYLYDASPAGRAGDSLASGLLVSPERQLTPRSAPATRRQLQVAQARVKQSKRIDQLLDSSNGSAWFTKSLASMLDQTAKEDQFRLAWSIFLQTRQDDPTSLAMQESVLQEMAERFSDRSGGRWANLRLERHRSSREWKRLKRTTLTLAAQTGTSLPPTVAVSPFQLDQPSVTTAGQVRQVSAIAPVVVPKPDSVDFPGVPNARAAAESKPLGGVDLSWEFHPAVLLATAAKQAFGDREMMHVAGQQSGNLRRLAQSSANDWAPLMRRNGPQVIRAFRLDTPPHLDGRLDDACWQNADASSHAPTAIRMAYDDDYVFVAVTCPASMIGPDNDANRLGNTTRDHDLSGFDRMCLCIDTDQDLMTSMRLQATLSRRTHDAIDDNPRWQPTWYLDVHRDDQNATFELAIQRRDLVDLPMMQGGGSNESISNDQSWFVSAQALTGGEQCKTTVMPAPQDWIKVIFR